MLDSNNNIYFNEDVQIDLLEEIKDNIVYLSSKYRDNLKTYTSNKCDSYITEHLLEINNDSSKTFKSSDELSQAISDFINDYIPDYDREIDREIIDSIESRVTSSNFLLSPKYVIYYNQKASEIFQKHTKQYKANLTILTLEDLCILKA